MLCSVAEVELTHSPLSPTAPSDYPSLTTSVEFPAGVTEQTVVISVEDDPVLEGTESFSLTLSPLSAGVVADDTVATVVIEDNDGQLPSHLTHYYNACIISMQLRL